MDSKQKAILKTLLYADLFDYPLTKTEILRFLISEKSIGEDDLYAALENKTLSIEKSEGYFYLAGRRSLVKKRQEREKISLRKLELAKKIINKISFIPMVKLIGISGALSMKNCDEDDDIDLFVITDKNSVWITRLFLVILLTFLGVYRNRQSKNHTNKICLNMILDKNHISFDEKNRDLYTAHEIVQLLPVYNKEKVYERFIGENLWVKNYIPNFTIEKDVTSYKNSFSDKLIMRLIRVMQLESIAKFLQSFYMRNHKTREIIKDGILKFHPYDYKIYILKDYNKGLLKYNLNTL
jgi:hypothetical protein